MVREDALWCTGIRVRDIADHSLPVRWLLVVCCCVEGIGAWWSRWASGRGRCLGCARIRLDELETCHSGSWSSAVWALDDFLVGVAQSAGPAIAVEEVVASKAYDRLVLGELGQAYRACGIVTCIFHKIAGSWNRRSVA